MKWLKNFFRHKVLVTVNYKSGIQKSFWVFSFDVKGGTYTWDAVYKEDSPVVIGVDEIESVWQGEVRWFGRSIWFWIIGAIVICYQLYSAF